MLSAILDAIFPPVCHLCGGKLSRGERHLCHDCIERLPRTRYHAEEMNPVELRFAGKFPFERATGHFFYSPGNSTARLIHDFKYRSYPGLARELGRIMGRDLQMAGWMEGIDVICAVPLHWWKHTSRGYNQSEEIAKGVSKETGIVVSHKLIATRGHKTQTSFSHARRAENVKGVFRLKQPELFAGKTILLIDDVCTTGATLTSAADSILAAVPTAKIAILTLAATF